MLALSLFSLFQSRWCLWTCKSSLHGWNVFWPGQLHHLPDCEVLAPVSACFGWNYGCVSSPASTRDICTLGWSHLTLWRCHCLSRSVQLGAWVLWEHGLQVSTKERDCWLLARGRWEIPSQRLSMSYLFLFNTSAKWVERDQVIHLKFL